MTSNSSGELHLLLPRLGQNIQDDGAYETETFIM